MGDQSCYLWRMGEQPRHRTGPGGRWTRAPASIAARTCIALSLLAADPGRLAAEVVTCPDPMFSVDAGGGDLAERICVLASEAAARLARCHLPQLAKVRLKVVDRFVHDVGSCLGRYDPADATLEVSSPDVYPDLIESDHPFSRVPIQELFDSVVVHELTHAFLDQQSREDPHCVANHEYMAYAMQMQTLSETSRQVILDNSGTLQEVPLERLNGFIAQAAPMKFAAWTWQHFSAPENGCGFIEKLVSREISLKLPGL